MEFVDLKSQYKDLADEINSRMQRVLEHGQFVMGPEVSELEQQLAKFIDVPHCITCSDGTNALLLAMMALEVGPGDEVITTPFSFFATAEMILLLGAKPVFVDIDLESYNLNPKLVEMALTKRTKAIMAVSLFGQMADMTAINAIANAHNIAVIEDAAQSFGARQNGVVSGSAATIACTSFFPSKPLGCYGDGGACFTADANLAQRLMELRNHGQTQRYWHQHVGLNSRLDTLQAAILLAKLEVFPAEIKARQRSAKLYDELLLAPIVTPKILAGNSSVYAQYTIRVKQRDALADWLKSRKIPVAMHYPTLLNHQPVFAGTDAMKQALPNAEQAANEVLSLPMHPYLTRAEINEITAAVNGFSVSTEKLTRVAMA
ncbi:MAG: DegT/DnrJ/EryC1/StrS family aminotransferase [Gammaproteobacteria bacterium]|nr:DegT/DnrJ/EryC1/StrS family aminotransferase [Gammaproteobacteria bacterium]